MFAWIVIAGDQCDDESTKCKNWCMMDAVMRQESQVLFQRPPGSRVSAIKPKGPRTRASCSSASFPALAPPMLSRAQKEPTGVGAVHKLMMPSTLALQDFG